MKKTDQNNRSKLIAQAELIKARMNTTAASVVAYRDGQGDYGDMSEQSQQEWLFVNRNSANTRELTLIENALRRIQEGTYGICSRCDKAISPQRLKAVPWAECCVQCQDQLAGGGTLALA
jgi:DnaK suppressor protein